MNLSPKQKKVALYLGITAIAVGYLIYRRNKNQKEATALIEYINTLPSQVDLSLATKQGMDAVRGTKIDLNKLKIDNLSGSYATNPKVKDAIAKAVVDLYASMKGVGTDHKKFFNVLARIKNKNTLAFVDKLYKLMFKEGLFEAMKDETALNNVAYAVFSDKTRNDIAIPFLSEGKWHPIFATYFNNLPVY